MKKYFERVGKKIGNVRTRMRDYWRNMMNNSTEKKMSQGAQEIDKIITRPQKDQWRRSDKK